MMNETALFIGGLRFGLQLQMNSRADEAFRPFAVSPGEQYDVTVRYLPDASTSDVNVMVSPEMDNVTVLYQPDLSYRFSALRGCLIYIPMEAILLRHDRFFLHASFVSSPWGGLLFTGNSGAGKSTQAELWKKYMGSTVINGDRAIVARENKEKSEKNQKKRKSEKSGWRAYGSPYAGSSGYYVQQNEPVKAIILLEKAEMNEVVPVLPPEAFQKLFLQVSLDHSRPDQVNRLCDLLSELVASVPVYRLRCTPDERAVEVLKNHLARV